MNRPGSWRSQAATSVPARWARPGAAQLLLRAFGTHRTGFVLRAPAFALWAAGQAHVLRTLRGLALAAACVALGATFAGCATPASLQAVDLPAAQDELIIVAIADTPQALPSVGATPRAGYARSTGYAGSTRAAALAAEVADAHALQQQAAWRIAPLDLRCMLYRIAPGAKRDAVLADLSHDPRVQLAQPLNQFETLAEPAQQSGDSDGYNDPYLRLQRGFAAIDAAEAQRWSRGDGVRVGLIDTGVDADHPDLAGRIVQSRDFVAGDHPPAPDGERHGTEMAGVIAADANNRIGIVGIAPQAKLLVYRACWPVAGGTSRCNSFTLAQALAAAIADDADVINLSLGGPADPLLQRLAEQAIRRGAIVVGAVPPGAALDGFPVGVPGVLAVGSSDDASAAVQRLTAPGSDILTLAPGGHYGFASGSSLAAAHVSGAVSLLRSLDPRLRAETARAWLEQPPALAGSPMDLCAAMRHLRPAAACGRLALRAPQL